MNSINLVGKIYKDPIKSKTGNAVRFTVMVRRQFQKDGEPGNDFFDCVAFGKTIDYVDKYVSDGITVSVTGSLQFDEYNDKEGAKRKAAKVIVNNISTVGRPTDERKAAVKPSDADEYDPFGDD
jgi:single-strand DNA-binding protein